jgi:hypothetical protein
VSWAGRYLRPLRQVIESVNQTFKGHLDLERHGSRTPAGVITCVAQRLLALTAAIWHNDRTGQPVRRSLLAYDHLSAAGQGTTGVAVQIPIKPSGVLRGYLDRC